MLCLVIRYCRLTSSWLRGINRKLLEIVWRDKADERMLVQKDTNYGNLLVSLILTLSIPLFFTKGNFQCHTDVEPAQLRWRITRIGNYKF